MAQASKRVNTEALLTTAEVAVKLRLTTRTIERMKARGDLPFVMLGNKVYYDPKDVEAYAFQRWSA